jgi:3-hydroxyacyl-[acyl-carrier-protein] dehydratase
LEPSPVAAGPPAPIPGGGLTAEQIRALLPQREPLLLIDRVLGVKPSRTIVAEKTVSATEPLYRESLGAYPFSLMLESIGQAAALLWLAEGRKVDDTEVLMLAAIRRYRVLGSAAPGEVLRHTVELVHEKADTAFASGRTCAGDRLLAEADAIVAVRRPRNVLGATHTGARPRPEEVGR